jgi:hypothetical protein
MLPPTNAHASELGAANETNKITTRMKRRNTNLIGISPSAGD